MKKSILSFLIVSASLVMHSQSGTSWQLLWSDEFSGDTLNTNNWSYEYGNSGWGNNELQNYTDSPSNIQVNNGSLKIVAQNSNGNYSSARIITKDHFQTTYGKIEGRIKLPSGQGLWPAFWMLGSNISQVGWPACGEIDIMEHINNESIIHGTTHWNNGGHVSQSSSAGAVVTDYHIYGLIWTDTSIKFYLDGILYSEFPIANNANNTGAFHNPFFFILNLAVGGNWPGNPDNTTIFPATMQVDYIRVYQQVTLDTDALLIENASISPNPFSSKLSIKSNLESLTKDLVIFNALGELVFQQESLSPTTEITTSDWPTGVYIVKGTNSFGLSKSFKIIKTE